MIKFDVLNRKQLIHKNYLLEASACTGNTFSIENIVVRLLIDPTNPFELSEILVVTFTKAATADLKQRIRNNLLAMQTFCRKALSKENLCNCPDYLLAVIEMGNDQIEKTARLLDTAIASFDRAAIFTIHGFCLRMLREFLIEADLSASAATDVSAISPILLRNVVRDFFRVGLSSAIITPGQLQRLIKDNFSLEKLENKIAKLMQSGNEIISPRSIADQLKRLSDALTFLKTNFICKSDLLIEDFLMRSPSYKEIADRKGNVKNENLEKIQRFLAFLIKKSMILRILIYLLKMASIG